MLVKTADNRFIRVRKATNVKVMPILQRLLKSMVGKKIILNRLNKVGGGNVGTKRVEMKLDHEITGGMVDIKSVQKSNQTSNRFYQHSLGLHYRTGRPDRL